MAAGAPTAQALLVVPGPEAQAAGEAKSAPQIRLKALREVRATRNGGGVEGTGGGAPLERFPRGSRGILTFFDDGRAKNIG